MRLIHGWIRYFNSGSSIPVNSTWYSFCVSRFSRFKLFLSATLRPKKGCFDFKNDKKHNNRILLEAEPQIGKTGVYLGVRTFFLSFLQLRSVLNTFTSNISVPLLLWLKKNKLQKCLEKILFDPVETTILDLAFFRC